MHSLTVPKAKSGRFAYQAVTVVAIGLTFAAAWYGLIALVSYTLIELMLRTVFG